MNVNIYLHYVMKYTNWLECSVLAREIWEQAIENSEYIGCGPIQVKVCLTTQDKATDPSKLWLALGEKQEVVTDGKAL